MNVTDIRTVKCSVGWQQPLQEEEEKEDAASLGGQDGRRLQIKAAAAR